LVTARWVFNPVDATLAPGAYIPQQDPATSLQYAAASFVLAIEIKTWPWLR
jgi:hypothetical protein